MNKDVKAEAREAADRILKTVWVLPNGEIELPVDPARIAAKLEIKVYEKQLDGDVSGVIVKEPELDPVILLNSRDSDARMRFTCAHELGHFVRNSNAANSAGKFEYVDLRSTLSSEGTDPNEIFANEFAANLLMPTDFVRDQFMGGARAVELAFRLGVSTESMQYRLKNLGLV